MRADLLRLAADLAQRGEAFALAVVVRRQPASSAQQGDMAVMTEAGAWHGWLGGSCIQPTIIREARQALADGRPRLISLSPEPDADRRPGVAVHPMTCHSGGTVDIYLEPVLPPPRLLVFGLAPAARALCRFGKAMGYAVDVVDPGADRATFPEADRVLTRLDPAEPRQPRAGVAAVVATMGHGDEEALLAALPLEPWYLGVVASRKRFGLIRDALAARSVSQAALARIRNPAGLDIGAKTPEEIALSILAEMVMVHRAADERSEAMAAEERPPPGFALDPVCGMTVEVAGARHTAEHAGRTWYFCNARCRERFLAEPERHAAGSTVGAT